MKRVFNFNAGPAALPLAVLERAQAELVDFQGSSMSVMEMSHRSAVYESIHNHAINLLRELLHIPDGYEILFLQGGASLQFSMVPMNFLSPGKTAAYVLTGAWSEKALKEAKRVGKTSIAASGKADHYRQIPSNDAISIDQDMAYLHITTNNTIYGTQWTSYPDISGIPLVADMSSDIMCKPIPVDRFSLIYAGAQKNLGPSGVTVVIVKKSWLEQAAVPEQVPAMMRYQTHSDSNSLYNTPPTFAIYMLSLVLDWVKEQGGVSAMQGVNQQKAKLLYDAIDDSNGFYTGHAEADSRSIMNVTFTLPTEDLTKAFLAEAKEAGFIGLAGHRSVGGCRASIYNAVPLEACVALYDFMENFRKKHQ